MGWIAARRARRADYTYRRQRNYKREEGGYAPAGWIGRYLSAAGNLLTWL